MTEGQYRGVCAMCDRPLHRQALWIATPLGDVHQTCALQMEQRAEGATDDER